MLPITYDDAVPIAADLLLGDVDVQTKITEGADNKYYLIPMGIMVSMNDSTPDLIKPVKCKFRSSDVYVTLYLKINVPYPFAIDKVRAVSEGTTTTEEIFLLGLKD